jgi:hypothetical protein
VKHDGPRAGGHGAAPDLLGPEAGGSGHEGGADDNFAIVFAAMGVNMETAHFFKQARARLGVHAVVGVCTRQGQGTCVDWR